MRGAELEKQLFLVVSTLYNLGFYSIEIKKIF